MKKRFLSLLLTSAIGLGLFAQKTVNDPNAETRNTGSFHGIEVGTGIKLTLTHGSTEEVVVSASTTGFRDRIVAKVENGILKIHYETKTGAIHKKNETKGLRAYVSYKTLDRLYASTGAEVEILGTLQSTSLEIKSTTGAEIQGKVDIGVLKLNQNTGSKITLSGRADKLEVKGSTGSKFTGNDLNTNTSHAQVSTGAKIAIHTDKELQARASTGGIVKYKGNAVILDIKTNTGGSVSRI
jgi:hypothetical protein